MLTMIAAKDLVVGANVRTTVNANEMQELKTSILRTGVLQNMIGAQADKNAPVVVFAGGRRLAAAKELIAEGLIEENFEVPVKVFSGMDPEGPEAVIIAMTENVIRADMDIIDQCDAMMKMARSGMRDSDIAACFGYTKRTVRERLLVADLVDGAKDLIRQKIRGMDWARAMTIADKATQKKIIEDIAGNPEAWATGEDIRRWISKATIEAKVALFDRDLYKGAVIRDFFEGDKFANVEKFWELQNAAIEDLRIECQAEGWNTVSVVHGAFEAWAYTPTQDKSEAHTIITVSPTGLVETHRGFKPIVVTGTAGSNVAALDADIERDESDFDDEIAPWEVRVTAGAISYCNTIRTAIVRRKVSGNLRNAMEIQVLEMLGHRDLGGAILVQPVDQNAGDVSIVTEDNNARMNMMHQGEMGQSLMSPKGEDKNRDRNLVKYVRNLSQDELEKMFAELTAAKIQIRGLRKMDSKDGSILNAFGLGADVRKYWTPDAVFFRLLGIVQMRRVAKSLLPHVSTQAIDNKNTKELASYLEKSFLDAAEGTMKNHEVAERLNAWVPGAMSFPAILTAAPKDVDDDDATSDLESAFFDA